MKWKQNQTVKGSRAARQGRGSGGCWQVGRTLSANIMGGMYRGACGARPPPCRDCLRIGELAGCGWEAAGEGDGLGAFEERE